MQIFNGSLIPNLTIAGRIFTDLKNLIYLVAEADTDKYSSFFNLETGAYYTPSAGKKFRLCAFKVIKEVVAGRGDFNFGTGSDYVYASTPAPTNYAILGAGPQACMLPANDDYRIEEITNLILPNAKYLCMRNQSPSVALMVTVFGYEEAI